MNDIEFKNDEERVLFEEARLGQDALTFLRTPLGKWLQAVAKQEKQNAMEDLLDTECYNPMEILHKQMDAKIADNFIRWIGEAIQNGRIAEQQLEEMDEDDV